MERSSTASRSRALVSDLVVYFAHPVRAFRMPRVVAILDWLLLLGARRGDAARWRAPDRAARPRRLVAHGREVLVVGAGDAAQLVIREMSRARHLNYTPIGLVDDDPRKQGLRIHGVKVVGTLADLPHILRDNRPDEVIIAIPSASGAVRQQVVEVAREAGVPVKTLPGLYELLSGDLSAQIRPVQVEDVLGREQIEVDVRAVAVVPRGPDRPRHRRRRLDRLGALPPDHAPRQPARIVLARPRRDAALRDRAGARRRARLHGALPVLADVGNETKLRQVFERFRPTVVFHAAAYKHVPLMEANPLESVRNNALATRTIARVAVRVRASSASSSSRPTRPRTRRR